MRQDLVMKSDAKQDDDVDDDDNKRKERRKERRSTYVTVSTFQQRGWIRSEGNPGLTTHCIKVHTHNLSVFYVYCYG